jgi:hypothetical protein
MTFDPRNILVIDFGQLGDVVLSLPALRAVREKFPDSDPTLTTWKKFGDKIALGTIKPAQPKVAVWEFEMPSGTSDPVGVLVVASSTEDPIATAELNPNTLSNADRHAALRETSVNMSATEIVLVILAVVGAATLIGVGAAKAAKAF